jgi:hypothetical protein
MAHHQPHNLDAGGRLFSSEGAMAKQSKISPSLRTIDARAMREAIAEFNDLGRVKFLTRYGFGPSSKYYLIFGQRLYDTKALVAAAYRAATGKPLRYNQFAGGSQTLAVFRRLAQENSVFGQTFEDRLCELRNLSTEYDRIPLARIDFRQLGFSNWIPLAKYADLNTGWLPGVYVIAHFRRQPHRISIIDKRIIYIGETAMQNLRKRLYQLQRSLFEGKPGHAGGLTMRQEGYHHKRLSLWLAVRGFPLKYALDEPSAESFRSAQIRHLERFLLYEYVTAVDHYPPGNSM